jgi:hypothetical protein
MTFSVIEEPCAASGYFSLGVNLWRLELELEFPIYKSKLVL